jgi:DNA-binding response OmpR family regulator
MKILLVEEDASAIAVLSKTLVQHHYTLDIARDGEAGWAYGSAYEYDLLLLNINLPKINGIQLCQSFREEGYTFPILLLAAQASGFEKAMGLDAGADDFIVQPYDLEELAARIRALLRRGSANPFPLLTWGELCINPSTYEVTYGSHPLSLTTKEYELLELFLRDSQRMLSTDDILDKLWVSEEFPAESTVRSHIRRLRRKLVSAGAPSNFIATIHGRGYCLTVLGEENTNKPVPVALKVPSAARLAQLATVMVVDEDEDWLRSLPAALDPWGFKLTTLADTQQFWSVLQAVRPDVLVLAVEIQPLSGLELCQVLRNDLSWQRLTLIVMGTLSTPEIQHQIFALGADDYLFKPITGEVLAQRIMLRLQRINAWVGSSLDSF